MGGLEVLRVVRYSLESSESNKTSAIVAEVEDRFGYRKISLTRVRGWRRELILKHLKLEPQPWNDNVVRVQVCVEAVKCARDKNEAINYIHIVKRLGMGELYFWASKLLSASKSTNMKARRAWRIMYG